MVESSIIDLPQPKYKPLMIGVPQHRLELEMFLEEHKLPYDEYIIRCKAFKVISRLPF